jgi:hypothetical protein
LADGFEEAVLRSNFKNNEQVLSVLFVVCGVDVFAI